MPERLVWLAQPVVSRAHWAPLVWDGWPDWLAPWEFRRFRTVVRHSASGHLRQWVGDDRVVVPCLADLGLLYLPEVRGRGAEGGLDDLGLGMTATHFRSLEETLFSPECECVVVCSERLSEVSQEDGSDVLGLLRDRGQTDATKDMWMGIR